MEQRLAMVIDAFKCMDCKACMAACKVANRVPEGRWRNWIKSGDEEQMAAEQRRMVFQPGNCMQCDKATCVQACPTGATYRNPEDGTILIDRQVCIGCGQCLPACPYGARYRHPELRVADKCDFCAERRAAGLEPACVSTCPTKARAFGDLNDSKSEVRRQLDGNPAVRITHRESDTDPNLYYLGEPGPRDWPVQARMPSAFTFWKNLANPLVKAFVGLTAAGAAAMLLGQLLFAKEPPAVPPEGGEDE